MGTLRERHSSSAARAAVTARRTARATTDCPTHVRCPGPEPQFTASALAAEGGGIDVAGSGADDLQSGPASQFERSACSESEQSEVLHLFGGSLAPHP